MLIKGRWPLFLLLGATALAVGVLFLLPEPNRARPLPEPPPTAGREAPAPAPLPIFTPVPASDASVVRRGPERQPATETPASGTDVARMRRQEILSIASTQFVYIGYTELNASRRGTLMRRSNRERIGVEEGYEIDGLRVRELSRDHCILAQEEYTYTLYLVDLAYVEKFRTTLPLLEESERDKAKRRRYFEEMFARPERARNSRVGEMPVAGPLTDEEVETGKRTFVAQQLSPKLDRFAAERASGVDPHTDQALTPNERVDYDPLREPPPHPSQMRPLTPDEYRRALEIYWARWWPGQTPLPGGLEPPPPPADLSEYVLQRRDSGG